jgi:hypothetical protein
LRGFKLIKHSLATVIEPLSDLVQIHAASCALDKRGTQSQFQILQAPADSGNRYTKTLRSLGQAACLYHHNEGANFFNLAHYVAVYIIID